MTNNPPISSTRIHVTGHPRRVPVSSASSHSQTATDTSQGSWSGKGLKKRKPNPSRLITKPGGILPISRSDYARENVIISEKKDKKASAFLVKDLPYPYTSKAQYEKRFETPVGAEWNSRAGYQRETLPRVMKKVGRTLLANFSLSLKA